MKISLRVFSDLFSFICLDLFMPVSLAFQGSFNRSLGIIGVDPFRVFLTPATTSNGFSIFVDKLGVRMFLLTAGAFHSFLLGKGYTPVSFPHRQISETFAKRCGFRFVSAEAFFRG
jgi:hypothetical protein